MREYFDSLKSRASSSIGRVGVEGQHVDARRHELARHAVAEVDDRLEQLALRRLEDSLLFADVDVGLHSSSVGFFVLLASSSSRSSASTTRRSGKSTGQKR